MIGEVVDRVGLAAVLGDECGSETVARICLVCRRWSRERPALLRLYGENQRRRLARVVAHLDLSSDRWPWCGVRVHAKTGPWFRICRLIQVVEKERYKERYMFHAYERDEPIVGGKWLTMGAGEFEVEWVDDDPGGKSNIQLECAYQTSIEEYWDDLRERESWLCDA